MAAAEEAPGGAGQEEGLEGLLGVSEGHDSALLSLRLQRGELVVAGDGDGDLRAPPFVLI